MKIAHVVCTFPPYKGGIGNIAYNFAKITKGHDVTIFTPNYQNINADNKNNFKVIRLNSYLKFGNGAFLPQLFFRLKKFDIVHLHYPFFGGAEVICLLKLFNKNKFKLIIHYHMDVQLTSLPFKILSIPSNLLFSSLFRNADIISCASIDYIKNSKLSKFYSKNKDKFYEIPFGVDINNFFPLYKKIIQPKISLLFVGGLDSAHYFKGVNILLKAVSLINPNKWELKIVGDGILRKNYINEAKKLNVLQNIKFLNKINNKKLAKIYRESDVFILPSINQNEAFGVVLLEAMASGLPVIASNLPGVRSVFKENIQGLLIKPNNANDLKNKINYLIENKNKLSEMSIESRKLVLEKYDWQKISNKLNKLYV